MGSFASAKTARFSLASSSNIRELFQAYQSVYLNLKTGKREEKTLAESAKLDFVSSWDGGELVMADTETHLYNRFKPTPPKKQDDDKFYKDILETLSLNGYIPKSRYEEAMKWVKEDKEGPSDQATPQA
ncbi:MAG: hypothetical protein Q9162_001969 [Coniocarpon cinnabarinum]